MRKWLLAICMFIFGCSEEGIPVRVLTKLPDDQVQEALAEAELILGISIDQVDYVYGAVSLDIHEAVGIVGGRAIYSVGCYRVAWSKPDPYVIAHELGHILSLEHVEDENNIMHKKVGTEPFTEWQKKEMEEALGLFLACR